MNAKDSFDQILAANGEIGYVSRVGHWVVQVEGLPTVALGEMVKFEQGQLGMVSALAENELEVVVLSREPIVVGKRVARMGTVIVVPVGSEVLGKTLNVLGGVVDGDGREMVQELVKPVDVVPTGIVGRKMIERQLITGIMMVDLMIPVGKGQRELIMGDRKTGKSFLLKQVMLAQAKAGSVCIYAAIGKKRTEIIQMAEFFKAAGISDRSVVVGTTSDDSAGEIYMTPYTAMTIGEHFRDEGRDVLIVMDDMSTHAKFYRELSLVSKKFPGRDSYPGDIFHIHSKLLERGGNFAVKVSNPQGQVETKEAAITVLPIVDTVQGDVTGYIQTNLMSMTDGHIYFDSDLFFRGRRPAINPFISVTRVGHQTQTPLAKDAGRVLFDLLANYEKTQGFLRFGAELGENSRQILAMGEKVLEYFNQPAYMSVPINLQLVTMAQLISGMWDGKGLETLVGAYEAGGDYAKVVDGLVTSPTFGQLIEEIRKQAGALAAPLTKKT